MKFVHTVDSVDTDVNITYSFGQLIAYDLGNGLQYGTVCGVKLLNDFTIYYSVMTGDQTRLLSQNQILHSYTEDA